MDEKYRLRSQAELDALYATPSELATKTSLGFLHDHHIAYLARSPLVCIASASADGCDVSPRGDRPGFVRVIDRNTLALPDWPGNNKIETLRNLVIDDRIGLLFLFPGLDIFLRIRGRAIVTRDPDLLAALARDGKAPLTAIVVSVVQVYYHCGRALTRSRLWEAASHIDRASLASPGTVMKDLLAQSEATAAEFDALYAEAMRKDLY